ncbi:MULTISPECIES: efflux RND transporter periplasmic adaptor subunit [unclassified Thioalkalivibrio]|uniref:efflux RND transporter periplasmic adaptor subunit n=1 Tax=unclassified Thioalkalivibrio TaxID=2621013 RepID=UPI0003A209E4
MTGFPRAWAAIASGLVLVLLMVGCGDSEPEVAALERPVKVMTVPDPEALAERSFSGRVEAADRAWLAFRVVGPVQELHVEVGDRVEEDAVLARLDPRDYANQVRELEGALVEARAQLQAQEIGARAEERRQLEAALEAAQARRDQAAANYRRIERMHEQGHVSDAQYDDARRSLREAEADLRSAREALEIAEIGARVEKIEATRGRIDQLIAQLDQARDRLDYTTLRAPFSGHVAERRLEMHEPVQAHEPAILLEDVDRVEVEVGIPEDLLAYRDRLHDVEVRILALGGRVFPGRVISVGVDVLPGRQTYPVRVAAEEGGGAILPGMTAEVVFRARIERGAGIRLPLAALLEDDAGMAVWVRDPDSGEVVRRRIDVVGLNGSGVLVADGVDPGEQVVIAGVRHLREGQRTRLFELDSPRGATP